MSVSVCYIAGREEAYSRTRTVLAGLQQAGFEVVTCLPPRKSFRHYPGLVWRFLKQKRECELIVVGFYGQLLLPWVWLFTRKPILYDIYISTYDTMVYDRERTRPGSLMAQFYRFVDWLSMTLSDRIILETRDHIKDYSERFGIDESKFEHVFLAVDERTIHPMPVERRNSRFTVHFHGEYAPFHGVRYILEAAYLLRDEDIEFQIVGRGITYDDDRALAETLRLENVRFVDWVPYDMLAETMTRADCCLGIFGDNPRTLRVLTNKVVEALAVGMPLISTRNDPIQELITDGESGLLVERANPASITEAILRLRDDPELRQRIGENGRQVFLKHCAMAVFSKRLQTIVEDMVAA